MTHRPHHLVALALASFSAACASNPIATSAVDAGLADSGRSDTGKADSAQAPEALKLEGVLIDDFEDGDGKTTYPGGAWYSYDDKPNGGGSAIAYAGGVDGGVAMNGPGYESVRSLEVTFSFDQGTLTYQPYVGWGAWFADKPAPLDASQFVGIAYTYRGSAPRVRVETF